MEINLKDYPHVNIPGMLYKMFGKYKTDKKKLTLFSLGT